MKQRAFQKRVYKMSGWFEIIISIIVLAAIVIFSAGLLVNLYHVVMLEHGRMSAFTEFLGNAFRIVIGVEFIKMLCKHTPATVVEVLMFAMARQMVVEHTSPLENLLCVLGIAVLFLIRRYLFTDEERAEHQRDQVRGEMSGPEV